MSVLRYNIDCIAINYLRWMNFKCIKHLSVSLNASHDNNSQSFLRMSNTIVIIIIRFYWYINVKLKRWAFFAYLCLISFSVDDSAGTCALLLVTPWNLPILASQGKKENSAVSFFKEDISVTVSKLCVKVC